MKSLITPRFLRFDVLVMDVDVFSEGLKLSPSRFFACFAAVHPVYVNASTARFNIIIAGIPDGFWINCATHGHFPYQLAFQVIYLRLVILPDWAYQRNQV